MNIFISYSSKSRAIVELLALDLEAMGYNVWFDSHLSGGEDWWNEILESIRRCHLFLFALTPEAQGSYPCRLEYEYASALNKRILPVLLADIDVTKLSSALQRVQYLDYRLQNKAQVLTLSKALTHLPAAKPLPKPLPAKPEIPLSPLIVLRDQIDASNLNAEEQRTVLGKLKELLKEQGTADDARMLLKRLRKRHDLLAVNAKEIVNLLNVKKTPRLLGKTRILVAEAEVEPRVFCGHAGPIFGLAYAPDNRTVLTGSVDKTMRLWDISTGDEMRRFVGHTGAIWNIACSPNGRTVLTSSRDKTARLWDFATGRTLHCLEGHTDSLWGVAYSPDGHTLLTGSFDKTVRLWDAVSGKQLHCLVGHTAAVWGVSYSPDGKTVLSSSWDKTVRLWDVATGKELCQFLDHQSPVLNVVYSPNGDTALTSEKEGDVYLWDADTCQRRQKLGNSTAFGLAYSPDGQTAVLGGANGKVQLLDIRSGKLVREFGGHTDALTNVAFAPDGATVLSASSDRTARLWNVF